MTGVQTCALPIYTILHLYQDESLQQELESKAREYFLEHFERKLATARYYDLLIDVTGL